MLMPKRVKYRKPFSAPRIKGNAKRGTEVVFGEYGLKALEPKWITARQIEAARVTLSRFIKKKGKLWIRIFPDKAITKHPAETRMGKGKGAPEYWAAVNLVSHKLATSFFFVGNNDRQVAHALFVGHRAALRAGLHSFQVTAGAQVGKGFFDKHFAKIQLFAGFYF